jgi:hypothetical protein
MIQVKQTGIYCWTIIPWKEFEKQHQNCMNQTWAAVFTSGSMDSGHEALNYAKIIMDNL